MPSPTRHWIHRHTTTAIVLLAVATCLDRAAAQAPFHQPDILISEGLEGYLQLPRLVHLPASPPLRGSRETVLYGRWDVVFAHQSDSDPNDWSVVRRSRGDHGLALPEFDLDIAGPFSSDQRARPIVIDRPGIEGFSQIFAVELDETENTPGDAGLYDLLNAEFVPLLRSGFQGNPGVAWNTNQGALVYDSSTVPGGDGGFTQDIGVTVFGIDGSGFITLGQEHLVSDFTGGQQFDPRAIPLRFLPRGTTQNSFLVLWESFGSPENDNDLASIQARFLGADGVPIGTQFQVNTVTAGFQAQPEAAQLTNGTIVMVWSSDASLGGDTSLRSTQARLFMPDGTPLGTEFQVNQQTLGSQAEPSVAALGSGSFIVAWTDGQVADPDVKARRFSAGGVALEDEFTVNQTTDGAQGSPNVVGYGNEFAVAWVSGGEVYFNGTLGHLFSDGLESGSTSSWSATNP